MTLSCVDEQTYSCECSFTIGSIQGDTSSVVQAADKDEAQTACYEFANEVGGNTTCEI
ncbi:MAG: hypothetical protein WEC59_06670 [Salibacteraceae bacterium]